MMINQEKKGRMMLWFTTIILAIILASAIGPHYVYAFRVSNVSIEDIVQEDLSVNESILINILDNNQSNFTFTAPNAAQGLMVNNVSIENNGSEISTPLNCTRCQVNISFHLDDVVTEIGPSEFDYSRNLGLPQTPSVLSYTLMLPAGYYLNPTHNPSISPSIVPKPTKIDTDGKNIVVRWTENNPSLPKTYYVKYYSPSVAGPEDETLIKELLEETVRWIILLALIAGVIGGFFIGRYYSRQKTREISTPSSTVPESLLNPDEKIIIKLLQDNRGTITQKDIGKRLEWSKSKVSAIMTNLEYKKIVGREKIGRNYKIELKKKMEDD